MPRIKDGMPCREAVELFRKRYEQSPEIVTAIRMMETQIRQLDSDRERYIKRKLKYIKEAQCNTK